MATWFVSNAGAGDLFSEVSGRRLNGYRDKLRKLLQAARRQLNVSGYQPAMATYVQETLEGKLTERVEVSGGLELAARIARAKKRLTEADNNTEEYKPSDE